MAGGPARQLSHTAGTLDSFAFSPAGDSLVYEADQGGNGITQVCLTTSSGALPRVLWADVPGVRAEFVRWGRDGQRLLYLCNRRDPRFMDLYEYTLATRQSQRVWEARGALALALASEDLQRLVLLETKGDADTNLFLLLRGHAHPELLTPHTGVDLTTSHVRALVNALPPHLRAWPMVRGQPIRFPSFDQHEVPGFLYQPAGEGPFPAVILVHGGPTDHARRVFDPCLQYLVSKGYVVLVPNVRGGHGVRKVLR